MVLKLLRPCINLISFHIIVSHLYCPSLSVSNLLKRQQSRESTRSALLNTILCTLFKVSLELCASVPMAGMDT